MTDKVSGLSLSGRGDATSTKPDPVVKAADSGDDPTSPHELVAFVRRDALLAAHASGRIYAQQAGELIRDDERRIHIQTQHSIDEDRRAGEQHTRTHAERTDERDGAFDSRMK